VRNRLADVWAARERRVDGDRQRLGLLLRAAAADERRHEEQREEMTPFHKAAVPRYAARTCGDSATAAGRPDAITAPAAMTTTRSATLRTRRRLCSTRSTATPRLRSPVEDRHEAAHVVHRRSRGRLVQQQHPRIGRERGRDGQQPLLGACEPVGVHVGRRAEADLVEHRAGGSAQLRVLVSRERRRECRPHRAAVHAADPRADEDVLERGQLAEGRGGLERSHEPAPRAPARRHVGEVRAVEDDAAVAGLEPAREQAQDGRLPRAAGAIVTRAPRAPRAGA
jgi:hypothetical protein